MAPENVNQCDCRHIHVDFSDDECEIEVHQTDGSRWLRLETRAALVLLFLALSVMWSSDAIAADTSQVLVLECEITLDHVSGRIDHVAIDLERRHLAVAELGNNTVDLIDLNSGHAPRLTYINDPFRRCVRLVITLSCHTYSHRTKGVNTMIREVEGDILLTKAQVVAHGVAPGDHFDSGLALSLRESWPAMVKDFRHFCQGRHPKAGEIWYWGGAEGPAIVNLMVQEAAYGHGEKPGKATLEHVHHALKALVKLVAAEGITSLALPRLATGVGGLEIGRAHV